MNTEEQHIIEIVKHFLNANAGDEATEMLIFAIGCEIFDVSDDKLMEMMEESNND